MCQSIRGASIALIVVRLPVYGNWREEVNKKRPESGAFLIWNDREDKCLFNRASNFGVNGTVWIGVTDPIFADWPPDGW
jgi:hypothetical protein